MARQKSLNDLDRRIEQLQKQRDDLVQEIGMTFAKEVIKDQGISTKQEMRDWYNKAKDAIDFKAEYDRKVAEHNRERQLQQQQQMHG